MRDIDTVFSDENKGVSKSLLFNNQTTWMDSREAAGYLRISVENLRVKVSRGEVPINGKLGRSLRFKREELDNLMESSINRGSNDY